MDKKVQFDHYGFIMKAIPIHGDKYDYSKVECINLSTKVCIICSEHGEFWQTPSNHFQGKGCGICGRINAALNRSSNILLKKFKGLIQPEDYKLIPLSGGKFAKVDNDDFNALKSILWSVKDASGFPYAINRVLGRMHRYLLNPPKDMLIDHINGDGLDNRRKNLRVCTKSQNNSNRKPRAGTSRFKGVTKRSDYTAWVVQISSKEFGSYSKTFSSEEEAAVHHDLMALKFHGEFASLNFPDRMNEYLRELNKG